MPVHNLTKRHIHFLGCGSIPHRAFRIASVGIVVEHLASQFEGSCSYRWLALVVSSWCVVSISYYGMDSECNNSAGAWHHLQHFESSNHRTCCTGPRRLARWLMSIFFKESISGIECLIYHCSLIWHVITIWLSFFSWDTSEASALLGLELDQDLFNLKGIAAVIVDPIIIFTATQLQKGKNDGQCSNRKSNSWSQG